MKNIIKSLVIVVAIAAVASIATWAYFSASDSVNGNTVATGTLKLQINEGAGKPITVSNIAPGYADSTYRLFDAYNYGTLPGEMFFRFANATGSTPLWNALKIELRDGGSTGACDGQVFYDGLISAFTAQKVSQYNVHASTSAIDAVADNIPANYTMRICQKISLPETGTDQNALQGTSVTFDEQVSDMQDANPDLTPVWP